MILSQRNIILTLSIVCGTVTSNCAQTIQLTSQKLEAINVKIEDVSYKGKKAVRVMASDAEETMAIIKGKNFENGIIELDIASTRLATASATARGFIGLAFR